VECLAEAAATSVLCADVARPLLLTWRLQGAAVITLLPASGVPYGVAVTGPGADVVLVTGGQQQHSVAAVAAAAAAAALQ
jgi:hypothetical protein